MKKLLFSPLAPLVLLASSLGGQTSPPPIPTWAQSYGFASYDHNGTPSTSGGSGADLPTGIAAMPDGGVVVAGQLSSPEVQRRGQNEGDFDFNDAGIVRYDRSGAIVWQQLLRLPNDNDGSYTHNSWVTRIRADAAGNIFICGSNNNRQLPFVAKFSADGALLWQTGLNNLVFAPATHYGVAEYTSMALTSDGGVIIGSAASVPGGGGATNSVPIIIKFNGSDGSVAFHREYATGNRYSNGISVCERPGGGGYAVFLYPDANKLSDNIESIVMLTDAVGNPVAQRILYSSSYYVGTLQFIAPSADGGLLLLTTLSGASGSEVRKLGADLSSIWQQQVSHFGPVDTLTPTPDGGCILGGQINHYSDATGNRTDVLLLTIDGSGNLTSVHELGGSLDEGYTNSASYVGEPLNSVITTDGGVAFETSSFSYATGSPLKADWWIVKTDGNGKVAGYGDTMIDLPISDFALTPSAEQPSVVANDYYGPTPAGEEGFTTTAQPAFTQEDLGNAIGVNRPTIKNQTVNPLPPPVHGGLSGITFAVNESDEVTTVPIDSVLRFRAVQNSRAAAVATHVQTSTDNGATWQNLADGASGQMSFIPRLGAYVLNTKNYPTSGSVYFRALVGAGGYGQEASNPVGPFDLTSSLPRIGGPLLFVTTNGEVNPIRFGVKQTDRPSGSAVRIQTSQTPADEASWTDATNLGTENGHMNQDTGDATRPADPNQFYVGTDEYPDSEGVYFRAVTTASGYADSLSFPYGPFKFVKDPPAVVSISINGVATPDGNDYDEASVLASGSFSMQANATSGRFIKRLTLLYDGVTIGHFDDGAAAGTINYRTNIPGDHIVEAYATDDLGVTGAAPPVHVRVLPAAPGRVFTMVRSGSWGDPANWSGPGDGDVPGPDDFAIVGSYSVTLDADRTVNALSMNGGTLSGAHTLTVGAFCTIGSGQIRSNLTIPAGSNCELLNDVDIVLTGTLTNGGTLRLHGKAGIAGLNQSAGRAMRASSVNPDGFFDFVGGIVHSVGKFFVDLAAGGRRGSHKLSAPPSVPTSREVKNVSVAKLEIAAGQFSVAPSPLVASGAGNLVATGAGNLVAQGAGNLVAQGAGNLVAQGAGNLVAQGAGNLVAQGAGNLIAQGAGNLVATGAGNLVAQGAGNLVASGAGNYHGPASASSMLTSSSASSAGDPGFVQSGGATDLTGMTINAATEISGGVLSGSAIIFGDLANNGGFLSPGSSGAGGIGVLGNFSQGANGTTILEDGGALPTEFDKLLVSGGATLDGTLIVNTITGYTPDAADTFNPLGYSSVSGNFATVSGNAQFTLKADGAVLSVNPNVPNAPAAHLVNIATRMRVETGDNALIGGFIVTGSAPKKVIIRAIGPSLPLDGALQDPTLELDEPDGTTIFDNDWRDHQEQEINDTTIPPSDNREAAIVATLAPGAYTAIVRGNGDTTGVGLVEVYDLDGAAPSQLANISTRGLVQTGGDVMIGGVIIAGTTPAKVLLRAIGPSLGAQGVAGALADPELELVDANGNTSSANQDWRNDQEPEIAATQVQPSDDREAAIVATLIPGAYTAIVRGKDGTTGVAVVEAYNLQ